MRVVFLFFLFISLSFSSTLNLAISSNPSRINPILATDSASGEISNWIFNDFLNMTKMAIL